MVLETLLSQYAGTAVVFLTCLIVVGWIRYIQSHYHFFKVMNIKGPSPSFLFGNVMDFGKTFPLEMYRRWSQKYGQIFGYYEALSPSLVVTCPKLAKEILVTQFPFFSSRPNHCPFLWELEDRGLQHLNGSSWKQHRQIVSCAMSGRCIREMFPTIEIVTQRLLEELESEMVDSPDGIIIDKLMERYSVDVMSQAAIGYPSNALSDRDDLFLAYMQASHESASAENKAAGFARLFPILTPLLKGQDKKHELLTRSMREAVERFVEDTLNNPTDCSPIMRCLCFRWAAKHDQVSTVLASSKHGRISRNSSNHHGNKAMSSNSFSSLNSNNDSNNSETTHTASQYHSTHHLYLDGSKNYTMAHNNNNNINSSSSSYANNSNIINHIINNRKNSDNNSSVHSTQVNYDNSRKAARAGLNSDQVKGDSCLCSSGTGECGDKRNTNIMGTLMGFLSNNTLKDILRPSIKSVKSLCPFANDKTCFGFKQPATANPDTMPLDSRYVTSPHRYPCGEGTNSHNASQQSSNKASYGADVRCCGLAEQDGAYREEIVGEVMGLLAAGLGPLASALTFVIYCLAEYDAEQVKVTQEVEKLTVHKGDITIEDLRKMPALERFINESIRMFPVAPGVARQCVQDCSIDGHNFPRGLVVRVMSGVMYKNNNIFPQWDTFCPDRFKESSISHSWMPFGQGPRKCVADRLAMVILKLGTAKILQNFSICRTQHTQWPLQLALRPFLVPKDGVHVKFVQR